MEVLDECLWVLESAFLSLKWTSWETHFSDVLSYVYSGGRHLDLCNTSCSRCGLKNRFCLLKFKAKPQVTGCGATHRMHSSRSQVAKWRRMYRQATDCMQCLSVHTGLALRATINWACTHRKSAHKKLKRDTEKSLTTSTLLHVLYLKKSVYVHVL